MADEKRIATFEWLNSSLYDFRKGTPPNNKKGVTKTELVTNYSVNESLLSSYTSNQLIPRGKCVGMTMLAYYPIDIEGAIDSDIQPSTNKLIVGGSLGVLSVDKDSYIGMNYHTINTTNGSIISTISNKGKLVRLNSDLSIDTSFNSPFIDGEVVSVDCFDNGNIAVRTKNGFGYKYNLFIFSSNGSFLKRLSCRNSRMNSSRSRLLVHISDNESDINNDPKRIFIIDSSGNRVGNYIYSSTSLNFVSGMIFVKDLVAFTINNNTATPIFCVYDVRDLNNIITVSSGLTISQLLDENVVPSITNIGIQTYRVNSNTSGSEFFHFTIGVKTTNSEFYLFKTLRFDILSSGYVLDNVGSSVSYDDTKLINTNTKSEMPHPYSNVYKNQKGTFISLYEPYETKYSGSITKTVNINQHKYREIVVTGEMNQSIGGCVIRNFAMFKNEQPVVTY